MDPRPINPEPLPEPIAGPAAVLPRPEPPQGAPEPRPGEALALRIGGSTFEFHDGDPLPEIDAESFALRCWAHAAVSLGCRSWGDTRGRESLIAAEQRRIFAGLVAEADAQGGAS